MFYSEITSAFGEQLPPELVNIIIAYTSPPVSQKQLIDIVPHTQFLVGKRKAYSKFNKQLTTYILRKNTLDIVSQEPVEHDNWKMLAILADDNLLISTANFANAAYFEWKSQKTKIYNDNELKVMRDTHPTRLDLCFRCPVFRYKKDIYNVEHIVSIYQRVYWNYSDDAIRAYDTICTMFVKTFVIVDGEICSQKFLQLQNSHIDANFLHDGRLFTVNNNCLTVYDTKPPVGDDDYLQVYFESTKGQDENLVVEQSPDHNTLIVSSNEKINFVDLKTGYIYKNVDSQKDHGIWGTPIVPIYFTGGLLIYSNGEYWINGVNTHIKGPPYLVVNYEHIFATTGEELDDGYGTGDTLNVVNKPILGNLCCEITGEIIGAFEDGRILSNDEKKIYLWS